MRLGFSNLKSLMLLVVCFFAVSPAFAQENIISSVTISKAKANPNAYELNIDSSDSSSYKMSVEDDSAVYFDLKNAVLSDDSATYYDDVANIDSAVVKQIGHNKVRIYLQGRNVKNTRIVFVNSIIEETKKPISKITINRPMNEYIPVQDSELEDMENIQDWDDNSFNLGQFLLSLRDGTAGIFLAALLVLAIMLYFVKTLAKKLSQDSEPLIGLKNSKYDLENDNLPKKLQENSMNMQTDNLEKITRRTQALQNAQNELSKAHQKYQQYLQDKYKGMPKKQYTSDSIKKGIALNQYQKSTQNPYRNQEVIKMDRISSENRNYRGNFQVPPRASMQNTAVKPAVQKNTSPYIQRKSNIPQRQNSYSKPDNMRFLESVTKIYEQSGRGDLAVELKNSIEKAKKL